MIKIDDLDREIINILQQDSKITNSQLAKEIGLSPSSTLERVRRLESSEIIKNYSLILNKEKLGINCIFLLYVKLNCLSKETVENFIDIINEIPEITEAYKITGNEDFLLKILVKKIDDYNKLLTEVLTDIEEVRDCRSEIVLNTIKENTPIKIKESSKLCVL